MPNAWRESNERGNEVEMTNDTSKEYTGEDRAFQEAKNDGYSVDQCHVVYSSNRESTYQVQIEGCIFANSLGECELDKGIFPEYLIDGGMIKDDGTLADGRIFMLLEMSVTKLTGNKTDPQESSTIGNAFSISGTAWRASDGQFLNAELVSYIQPIENTFDDIRYLYYSHISDIGDSINCTAVYMVDKSIVFSDMYLVDSDGKDAQIIYFNAGEHE